MNEKDFERIYYESRPEEKRAKSFGELLKEFCPPEERIMSAGKIFKEILECDAKPLQEQSKLQEKLERLFEVRINDFIDFLHKKIKEFDNTFTSPNEGIDFTQIRNYIFGNNENFNKLIIEISNLLIKSLQMNDDGLDFNGFGFDETPKNPIKHITKNSFKDGIIPKRFIIHFLKISIELVLYRYVFVKNVLVFFLNPTKIFRKNKEDQTEWRDPVEENRKIFIDSILEELKRRGYKID